MHRLINFIICVVLIINSTSWALQKNIASQKWVVFAFDETDNTAKTGDAAQITANVRIDGGAADDVTDTNPTELEDGYYVFDITAGESNGDCIVICPDSSTANIQVIGCPMALWTSPPYFPTMSIDSNGRLDIIKVAGTTQTANDMSGDIDTILIDTTAYNTDAEYAEAIWGAAISSYADEADFGGELQSLDPNITLILADTAAQDTSTELRTLLTGSDTAVSTLTASSNIGINWADISNPTTAVDLSATDIQLCDTVSTLTGHTAQTGDSYARLGAPAGASVSVDIASNQTDLNTIIADTSVMDPIVQDLAGISEIGDKIIADMDANSILADLAGISEIGDKVVADMDANSVLAHGTYGLSALESLVDDIGVAGAGLSTIPWNASWDAEVESEVDDALIVQELDHLVHVADADDPANDSIVAKMFASDGDWSGADKTTDSLEAIRDGGDSAWTTGGGTGLTSLATGTAQAGAAGTITLAAGASATNNLYNGARVMIHTGTGLGQSRLITAYNGTSKVATVHRNWVTNPDNTSQYEIQASDTEIGWIEGGDATDALDAACDTVTVTSVGAGVITDAACADDIQVDIKTIETTDATDALNTEADNAIVTYKLDHLVYAAESDDPADNSIMAKIFASDGDWSGGSAATDALEALADAIAAFISGSGVNLTAIEGHALAGTGTQVADGFEHFFDVGTPGKTMNDVGLGGAVINSVYNIPAVVDIAGTATVRLGMSICDCVDDLPSTAEITPGTIKIEAKRINGTVWSVIVNDEACLEAAGLIYYDEVFNTASGYREEDALRITFKNQKVVIGGNDFEITGSTGAIFHSYIRKALPDVIIDRFR